MRGDQNIVGKNAYPQIQLLVCASELGFKANRKQQERRMVIQLRDQIIQRTGRQM